MEFIQWLTSGFTGAGKIARKVRGGKDTTHHALFRLDSLDVELMDKDIVFELRNEESKIAAEEGMRVSGKNPVIRVSEDDLEAYKEKCVEAFKKILS